MKCNIKCVSWNVQSLRNKCNEVMEHVIDYNADVVFITETWMEAEKNDVTAIIKNRGYKLLHNRRKNRDKDTGGGVGIMVRNTMKAKPQSCKSFSSFEHSMVEVKLTNNTKLVLVAIYRLQFISQCTFLEEFMDLLEMLSVMEESWIVSGDVNLHMETNEHYATSLKDTLLTYNLTQYVNFPTHQLGHTLDVVLARYDSPKIINIEASNVQLSDHYMVTFDVEAEVVKHEIKTVICRNFSNNEKFVEDVREKYESLKQTFVTSTTSESVTQYNNTMSQLLMENYPPRTKQIKIVPKAPWFDLEYVNLRKQRRKAEKKYKRTKLTSDKEAFVSLRKQTTSLALKKQKEFYVKKIADCKGNKAMFTCVNQLLDRKKEAVLPECTSDQELANNFSKYFKDKISKIRKSFPEQNGTRRNVNAPFSGTPLTEFEPTTEDEITGLILKYGIKCAPHDPIPANVLKTTYSVFIPIWTDLVNLSLSSGSVECLKVGVLLPAIKELDDIMDCDTYKNYRPLTNLEFVGKLIERVVKIRTDAHFDRNNLGCVNQYGYKSKHSTEMLMTKVSNDLLLACDNKNPTLVMFLDLSAAFDTVDQDKLLCILEEELGIQGTALKWYESFLKGRTQRVKIGESYSEEETLDFGVAQGSILGPPLFNAYARTFPSEVKAKVKFTVEGYADDHQLLKQFNIVFQIEVLGEGIEDCFKVIDNWMKTYFLKLNPTKTKIMIIAPPSIRDKITINGTFINGQCIRFVDSAKNLGVLFDSEMSMTKQVNKVVSSCFLTIRLVSRIKYFFITEQLNTMVCSMVFSILDYCNVMYYGLNKELIQKMQRVQNSAARLVMKVNRFDKVDMDKIFKKLHWLRIQERIVYKVLLIVHKCVHNLAPSELCKLFRAVSSDRTKKLDVQSCNGAMGERAISVSGPKLWNALPRGMRVETCTEDFKKSLKTFLFSDADRFYETVYRK